MATFDTDIELNNQKMPHLKVNGALTFYNLEIEKDVTTGGPVIGTHIKCQHFKVKGGMIANNLKCQDLEVTGSVKGSKIECRNFTINGPVEGVDIAVNGKAWIDGDCKIDDLNVKKDLTVRGAATGKKWDINQKTEIVGYLNADESRFKNIELYSHDSALSNSTVENIVFKHCEPSNISRILRLSKNTVVNGTITFEDGEGTIYIDSSSKIKGAIRGGNVNTLEDDEFAKAAHLDTVYDMTTKRHYRNHNGLITDEFSITVDKPSQKKDQKNNNLHNSNNNNKKAASIAPLLLILGLLASSIASVVLGAPLWLGLTLGIITSLFLGAWLAKSIIESKNNNARRSSLSAQTGSQGSQAPTPVNTPAPSPTAAPRIEHSQIKPKPRVRFDLNLSPHAPVIPPKRNNKITS